MPMVKIMSDSTCDLTHELREQYGVEVLPLHILLGDKEYLDGESITPEMIFNWSDENRSTPKTSAISVDEAVKFFRPWLEQGNEIVCFTISSAMSGTCQNLRLAAGELNAADRICVIDSRCLSTGVGLQVLEAAELAQQGLTAAQITERIRQLTPRVRGSFVVDTLTYLHRGGRCSGLAAMAGGALKLHPRINVSDGVMGAGKKYRGRMNRVVLDYLSDMRLELEDASPKRIFITHAACSDEVVAAVRTGLEEMGKFEEILTTQAGCVISSHCGPGTLGLMYCVE